MKDSDRAFIPLFPLGVCLGQFADWHFAPFMTLHVIGAFQVPSGFDSGHVVLNKKNKKKHVAWKKKKCSLPDWLLL